MAWRPSKQTRKNEGSNLGIAGCKRCLRLLLWRPCRRSDRADCPCLTYPWDHAIPRLWNRHLGLNHFGLAPVRNWWSDWKKKKDKWVRAGRHLVSKSKSQTSLWGSSEATISLSLVNVSSRTCPLRCFWAYATIGSSLAALKCASRSAGSRLWGGKKPYMSTTPPRRRAPEICSADSTCR
jgi:hypothetical protein